LSSARDASERILVLAPTADDSALIAEILKERGLEVCVLEDIASLARALEAGAGLALIASEAFSGESAAAIRHVLDRQEPWSEIPILLFGGNFEDAAFRAPELLGTRVQIVILERPLGIATFMTATDAALRSRRRQYEVKRLLDELALSAVEIARANEEATRAKDDFLATLGHELRSPMTAIRGWIALLRTGELAEEEAATALAMIESSTKVQAHIIEDLMDVSKIIAGKAMIEPAATALGPLIETVAATFRPAAVEHGIELEMHVPDEPLIAWADEARILQVGWNLISNAIKFTPRGGRVAVSLAREGDRAVIRVSDTGEGIAAELLPHVFERYRQAEGGSAKQHVGLGLGLAIVQHLVAGHGGTIEAFSEGAGRGSEFVVSLPLHDVSSGAPGS
jgi:two-component system, sensor histidine kinase